MALLCLPALALLAAPTVEVTGDWTVRATAGATVVSLAVTPATSVDVTAEKYDSLPVYNPKAGGWARGAALRGIKCQECTVRHYLVPETLVLRDGPGADAAVLVKGKDYEADLEWGTLGRIEGGWPAGKPVWISYRHGLGRIDSIVLAADGRPAYRQGQPHASLPQQPALGEGESRVCNLWVPGRAAKLTPASILPVLETAYPEPPKPDPTVAEKLTPKALAKLRSGEKLRLLAWGDSVTDAGYLPNPATQRWQAQFVTRLRERFPKADIELINLGWGGRNTDSFLGEPPGSPFNYAEKVLGAKPDLIVSEFVNDAWMTPDVVETKYSKLLADFQALGAEWIILTPHYVRGDWMGLDRESDIDQDPRPYVAGLRAFAAKHNIALADASLRWGRLWRQGIPYSTLLSNAINHPDPRGMKLFADALMALFP